MQWVLGGGGEVRERGHRPARVGMHPWPHAAVGSRRVPLPAEPVVRLEHGHVEAGLERVLRRHDAGWTRTDDGDASSLVQPHVLTLHRGPSTRQEHLGFRTMAHGTHDFSDDPRNDDVLIWVSGELVPRKRAVVSVFDSGFVLGDGVWEGLRVRGGHPAFLERHLDRLFEGAKAIMLDIGLDRAGLTEAIYATLRANEMSDGVHVRLMVTRGVKRTPYQDPRVTIGPATVVIIAEHKEALPSTVIDGITLFTTHVRRAAPDTLDPKLNAHSKLNDITACIQAYTAGADEALMLDPHGFVATCNSTHFFAVIAGEVLTSDGRYTLAGITRANVLELCRANGIPARETTFSLTDVYSASEAFVTGTFAGVVPVRSVDGRTIGEGRRGPVVERLQTLYRELVDADVAARAAP